MDLSDTSCVKNCVVCGQPSEERDLKFEQLLGLIEPYEIKLCEDCGLRWLSPRPTEEMYAELYSSDDYLNSVESYEQLAKERAPYFRERIRTIERYMGRSDPLDILELGAATGEFINEARIRSHSAVGVELSEESVKIASDRYGVSLMNRPIEEFDDLSFDVIHMNHVFEHLLDPIEILKQCRRILRPGGIVVIEIPQQLYNDLDRLKRLLGLAKTPVFNSYSLHHTYFYNPENIRRLFEDYLFDVEKVVTCNPARTPLVWQKPENFFLRVYLWLADKLHKGGNIIEVYARKL